jgi:hypothetical protein
LWRIYAIAEEKADAELEGARPYDACRNHSGAWHLVPGCFREDVNAVHHSESTKRSGGYYFARHGTFTGKMSEVSISP